MGLWGTTEPARYGAAQRAALLTVGVERLEGSKGFMTNMKPETPSPSATVFVLLRAQQSKKELVITGGALLWTVRRLSPSHVLILSL
jgi:hypothetical protein